LKKYKYTSSAERIIAAFSHHLLYTLYYASILQLGSTNIL